MMDTFVTLWVKRKLEPYSKQYVRYSTHICFFGIQFEGILRHATKDKYYILYITCQPISYKAPLLSLWKFLHFLKIYYIDINLRCSNCIYLYIKKNFL